MIHLDGSLPIIIVILYFSIISPSLSFLVSSKLKQQQQFLFLSSEEKITTQRMSHAPSVKDKNYYYSTNTRLGPPIDAVYELSIRIPVIGKQHFQLRIHDENRAELKIDGRLLRIHDRNITYEITPLSDDATSNNSINSGELSFQLSEETIGTLKRFRTTLTHATYCPITDTPRITVSPPLPMNINLKLKRKEVILE